MPQHSCSIMLQLERDNDYKFLNNLRMASGYREDHPAHISLITNLRVFSSLDLDSSDLVALMGELQRVAECTSPFRFTFVKMDRDRPFGEGAGCVALVVKHLASLTRLHKALKSRRVEYFSLTFSKI